MCAVPHNAQCMWKSLTVLWGRHLEFNPNLKPKMTSSLTPHNVIMETVEKAFALKCPVVTAHSQSALLPLIDSLKCTVLSITPPREMYWIEHARLTNKLTQSYWSLKAKLHTAFTLPAADRTSRDSRQHADTSGFILTGRGRLFMHPCYIYTALCEGQGTCQGRRGTAITHSCWPHSHG